MEENPGGASVIERWAQCETVCSCAVGVVYYASRVVGDLRRDELLIDSVFE